MSKKLFTENRAVQEIM